MFGGVHAFAELLEGVGGKERHLDTHDHRPGIDTFVGHPMHHHTGALPTTGAVLLPRTTDGIGTGQLTGKCRMEVDDRVGEPAEELHREHAHPTREDDEIRTMGANHRGETSVVLGAFLVTAALDDLDRDIASTGPPDHRCRALVGDQSHHLRVENSGGGGVDDGLEIRTVPRREDHESSEPHVPDTTQSSHRCHRGGRKIRSSRRREVDRNDPDNYRHLMSRTGVRTVGVVGAGQLARMMYPAAIALDLDLVVMGSTPQDPAALVAAHTLTAAATPTRDDLARLAAICDVVTVEHELVEPDDLAALDTSVAIRPSPTTLATVTDKVAMRTAMDAAGLPGPRWTVIESTTPGSSIRLAPTIAPGDGAVVKAPRGGYDGRGVMLTDDHHTTMTAADEVATRCGRALVEQRLAIDAEIAVLVVRDIDGRMETYPVVLTVQAEGQCREVRYPSGLDPALEHAAVEIARHAARAVEVIGVLAVEMFVVGDALYVNELAARPHNSGHLSIEAFATSQFANHLRAVAGLPLGSTAPLTDRSVMVNLIGVDDQAEDPRHRLAAVLARDRDLAVHLYHKAVRRDRKVGHVTLCSSTEPMESLRRRAWEAAVGLGGQALAERPR